MIFLRLLGFVTLLVVSGVSMAAQTLVVATDIWEGYSNEDGTGYYTDLLKAIYEPQGINVVVKYVPYMRSIEMLDNHKADVMLGAYQGEDITGSYGKYPIEIDVVDAAVSKDLAANWQGIESLSGKKVGAVRGNEFSEYTDVEMKYREVSNLRSLLKMLNHQRIDAVLDYEPDIISAEKTTGEKSKFEVKTGVLKNPSFFVFAKSSKGKNMKEVFDQGFLELYQAGKVKEIYIANTGGDDGMPILN